MRILLTNDDGIEAPGIAALHDALHGLGEIVPYLESRGFCDVVIFDHTDMQRTYLGRRSIAAGVYIASGWVRG